MADSEYDIPAAKAHLTAVIAGIDACPDRARVPMLRMFLDRGLDRLEAIEDGSYAFLAECALLAGQNMQDVRLQSLEAEVDALKNPEGPTATELLTEIAIVLAVELAIVGFVHIGVGALLLAVGQRAASKAARTSLRAAEKEAQAHRSQLSQITRQRELRNQDVRRAIVALGTQFDYSMRKYGEPIISATYRNFRKAVRDYQFVDDNLAQVQRALLESEDAAAKAAAAMAQAKASPEATRLSGDWKKFLDDALRETTLQRVHQSAGETSADLLARFDAKGDPSTTSAGGPAFLSSWTIGLQLGDIRVKRLAAAAEYAALRHHLRSLDEEQVVADERVQDLAFQIVLSIPVLESRLTLADFVRPAVVDGYELALWYEWLATSGMLSVDPGKTFDLSYALDSMFHAGIVIADHEAQTKAQLWQAQAGVPYVYKGDFYAGIPRLSEFQAEYLYQKFARRYFEQGLSSLPFAFDPAAYENVYAAPTRHYLGLIPNAERARRLDEMRYMVILFFIQFFERIKDKSSYAVAQELTVQGKDWLAQIPHAQLRWDESAVDDTAARESVAGPLNALLAESDLGREFEIAEAEANLRLLAATLEQNIWFYVLVYSQSSLEAADTPFGQSADEALAAIEGQQKTLDASFAGLKALADTQSELLSALVAELEARVTALVGWLPDPPTFDADGPGESANRLAPAPRVRSRWHWAATEADSPSR